MDTIEAAVFITGPFLLICKNIGRTSMNVNLFKKKITANSCNFVKH